jgi:succinyl-diaminopimelate desuccinylase
VRGSLSLLITGDEEGVALDGTKRMVAALQAEGERIDHCIVGEPSSSAQLGDMIKVGRRGSLNAWLTVNGRQGHVAYPDRAANPIPVLVRLLERLQGRALDDGYESFPPSNLEITTVDVGNPAANVIPATATGRLNIRFNPSHTGAALIDWLEAERAAAEAASGLSVELKTLHSGDAFLDRARTLRGPGARHRAVGHRPPPEPSTSGGTSDARFIRALCPVVELGLVGATIHQIDERAPVADIQLLQRVYAALIARYFATSTAQ